MTHEQKPLEEPAGGWGGGPAGIWLRFQRFFWDVGGIFILAFALMTLLALLGITGGALLTPWSALLLRWLGGGSYIVVLIVAGVGALMLGRRFGGVEDIPWRRVLALETAAFALIALLAVIGGVSIEAAEAGEDGGLVGWGLAELIGLLVGGFWRTVILVLVFFTSLLIGIGRFVPLLRWAVRRIEGRPVRTPAAGPAQGGASLGSLPLADPVATPTISKKPADARKKATVPPEFRKNLAIRAEAPPTGAPPPRDQALPPLDILHDGRMLKPNERNINMTAGMIEKTLTEFGVPARVVGVQVGPTVTQFAVEPGFIEKGPEGEKQMKVRVAQIMGLQKDLALALSASRLRIEAPVPGKAYVGIEVPNLESVIVRLKPILESENFYKARSPLAIALGLDVSGRPVVADLAAMPHILIAGTTGSGKSVCIGALTTCLAINNTPETLRLVMIDPKKVELVRFNGLPHLYGQVETDLERIMGVLRWTVAEMDRRYKLLETHRTRNVQSFNNKMSRMKDPPENPLPYIVVMIDELADLMMSAPDQTEPALVRLAQLARATGIHLVVATQRPSTDVVTGLIKANFPARLAFSVASGVDSRVILDTNGAESLLGDGDMLFLQPDAAGPLRAQGVFVSDPELDNVVRYWQKLYGETETEPPWDAMLEEEAVLADRDGLLEQAIEVVRRSGRVSASMLQRRLRVGYPRAARLVDELEAMGIIGPAEGGRDRDVLIGSDDTE
ncbi:MAG TPA: DNA translocase FtsK [Anaerolineales bacterium]|nr:DNA translocase FtsK [Anaerolineales bacterium]